MGHECAAQLPASSPRLREALHFGNSSHINNINHNSVVRTDVGSRVSRSCVLMRLVLGVAGRFQLERAVVRVEVRAKAADQLVQ